MLVCWPLLYSTIPHSRADSLCSHVILHQWLAFYSPLKNFFFKYPPHGWCHMKLLPPWCVLCAPYNHAPCHFMQSHIRKVYACLAVTCHLRFWQNDRGLLRATAVTRGWNGYRNKSQHRKLTLEKKILPPLLQGFEPAAFRSRVRCSNHWAIPAHLTYHIALAWAVSQHQGYINLLYTLHGYEGTKFSHNELLA